MQLKKIVYINLDQRKDRRRKIEKVLNEINVPFERFAAIQPSWEDIDEGGKYHELYLRCIPRLKKERESIRGRIGCWLSHKMIIDQNIDSKEPVLIIEDDIEFKQEDLDRFVSRVEALPEDWDIFRVCWKYTWRGRKDFINDHEKQGNISKLEDFIFKVVSNRQILGGSHFVLCQNFKKISEILNRESIIEADKSYSTKGMNSYLTRLVNLRQLRMGSDIT